MTLAPIATACGSRGLPLGDAEGSADDSGVPDGSTDDAGVVAPHAALPMLGPHLCDPRPDAMGFFLEGGGDAEYSVVVTPVSTGLPSPPASFALDATRIGRADVSGLAPETTFLYDLLRRGARRRRPATRASSVRIAIGADIHREWKPYVAFERIRELAPDALVMIGDQIYADYRAPDGTVAPTEEAYRALYRFYWADPSLSRSARRTARTRAAAFRGRIAKASTTTRSRSGRSTCSSDPTHP